MSQVSDRLAQQVRRRAHGCCEYCQSQERVTGTVAALKLNRPSLLLARPTWVQRVYLQALAES